MTLLSNVLLQLLCGDTRQDWDLGPFASVLQNLHLDIPLLEQQNAKKLYWTKNNYLHAQLGKILDTKERNKHRILRIKAGYCECLLHTILSKRWATLNHSSDLTPGHTTTLMTQHLRKKLASILGEQTNKGICCLFLLPLLQQGPQ